MTTWTHNLYSSYQVGLSNESWLYWYKFSLLYWWLPTEVIRSRLSNINAQVKVHYSENMSGKSHKSQQYWGWEICGYKWKDLTLHKVDCPKMILQHQRFNKYQPVDDEVKIKGVASRGTEADHLTSTMHAIMHTVWREASLPVLCVDHVYSCS